MKKYKTVYLKDYVDLCMYINIENIKIINIVPDVKINKIGEIATSYVLIYISIKDKEE